MTAPEFPAEGIHLGVSNADYHGDKTAVSRSPLAKLVTGMPSDLHYSLGNQAPPTKDMLTGSLADDLFYQGTAYVAGNYLIRPEGMKLTTKDGINWRAENKGDARPQVVYDQWTCARGMRAALLASPLAMAYLGTKLGGGSLWQSSHVWREIVDRENGLPPLDIKCKCRPDTLLTERGIVVDLKTTGEKNIDRIGWTRNCENNRLDLQAAFYLDGCNAATGLQGTVNGQQVDCDYDRFIWVVVSRQPPHRVEVYECGQAEIAMARDDLRAALQLYAACKEADSWPSSSGQLQQINYRPWAMK